MNLSEDEEIKAEINNKLGLPMIYLSVHAETDAHAKKALRELEKLTEIVRNDTLLFQIKCFQKI